MVEQYYIVEKGTKFYSDWREYRETKEKSIALFEQIKTEFGIESDSYRLSNRHVYIIPTEKDKEKFGHNLLRTSSTRHFKFRSTSNVGMAWVGALLSHKLHIVHRPSIVNYVKCRYDGTSMERAFVHDGTLYLGTSEMAVIEAHGLQSITKKEFHKVLEESLGK